MSNSEILQQARSELAKRELARRSFFDFVPYVFPNYSMKWFHKVICEKLELVRERKIKKLMIFMPPQHGKSQLATRLFPAYLLGRNPNEKIAIASYSARLSMSFSRASQRSISDKLFFNVFPDIRLPERGEGSKTAEFFEIIGGNGSVMSVGVEGSLTGSPVDIGIIDDPIKDRQTAQSLTVRESTWAWYVDVFSTRLHNNSAQLIIQTRWHEDDLSGRILTQDGFYSEDNPNGWVVVKFAGLRTNDQNDYDPREEGEALWPERHSQERLELVKAKNTLTFDSLYQQDPKPSKDSLVFPDWEEIDEFPIDCDVQFFGLDFGFTNDPTAMTRIGKTGNNIYLDEYIYETGLTNTDIRLKAKSMGVGRIEIFCDSAEPKSIEELKNPKDENNKSTGFGLNAIASIKGAGSINAGISKLREYKVYYTKRSLNIKREKNNYSWIMAGGVNTNVPIDSFNHAIDGIRGAVYTKYGQTKKQWVAI